MLQDLYMIRDQIKSKRVSSFDRTGGNKDRIQIGAQSEAVIMDVSCAGIIKHIWVTIASADKMVRRNTVIRMYWDGEQTPSVLAPIGDFFGQGFGEHYNWASAVLAGAPANGKAMNSYFPMPFGTGAKITIENQSDLPIDSFYFYIDYEEHPSIPDEAGRFHAWWNRELTHPLYDMENEWTTLRADDINQSNQENYLFADIVGKGKFVGVNYYVDNPTTMWYGEGDDMFQIDGEPYPFSLHGTGTEDFFNASWCPKQPYTHPYFGYARVNGETGFLGRTHCYRFMVEDPIYFEKSLHASIEHGHANGLTLDISSVAYWYQIEPHKAFPMIRPASERQNMAPINSRDILRWRDAWRRENGGGTLWGNEQKEKP